jgi:hypothetical protein
LRFTIDDNKITRYLLNSSGSTEARGQAAFFQALGFSVADPEGLRRALIAHSVSASRLTDEIHRHGYGRKIIFECALPQTPKGGAYCVRTVWIEADGGFRFVPAYPRERPML